MASKSMTLSNAPLVRQFIHAAHIGRIGQILPFSCLDGIKPWWQSFV